MDAAAGRPPRARMTSWPPSETAASSTRSALLTDNATRALVAVGEPDWQRCITQDREEREGAKCAEIIHLLDLSPWPSDIRVIPRRDDSHPGPQFTFIDVE